MVRALGSLGRVVTVCLTLALAACGGGGGGGGDGGGGLDGGDPGGGGNGGSNETADPRAPAARAGENLSVTVGEVVTLDGSRSADPEGGTLRYDWVQTYGEAVPLSGASGAVASFTAPSVDAGGTTLVFRLTVTDPEEKTGTDLVTVHVDPPPSLDPTAVIDAVEAPAPGDLVVLGGSHSTDPRAGELTYEWTQIDGVPVTLDGAATDTGSFVAPDSEGDLVFRLTVTNADQRTASAQATVAVTATPPPPPRSSAALIDAAVERGDLSPAKGKVYKVLALFNDARLPEPYQGTAPGQGSGTAALNRVAEDYDTLSAEDRALVAPYLLPPYVRGSWDDLRERGLLRPSPRALERAAGRTVQAPAAPVVWKWVTNGQVKVWYKDGLTLTYGDGTVVTFESLAEGVLDAVGGKIWASLEELMNKEPLSDAGLKPRDAEYSIQPGDFDDSGKLDIILSHGMDCYGVTVPYRARPTPAFLVIDAQRTPLGDEFTKGLVQTVAHELMHAWQFSYPTKDPDSTYSWLMEANAVWTEDYVYPKANTENEYTKLFMDTMSMRLDNRYNDRDYGAYLPFTYWTHNQSKGGPPDIIRQIWEAAGTKSSLDAVDAANPLPFADMLPHFMSSFTERYWGDFLAAAWNHGADGYYLKKDAAVVTPKPVATKVADMDGSKDRSFFLGALDPEGKIELPYLSGRYYYFLFRDDAARSVIFFDGLRSKLATQVVSTKGDGETEGYMSDPVPRTNPMLDPSEGATWKVLVKVKGKWKDWTADAANAVSPLLGFCRDSGTERIEEMAVALGNSSATETNFVTPAPGGFSPLVFVSNLGCWRWEGDITVRYTHPDGGPNETTTTHLVLADPVEGAAVPLHPGVFAVTSATTTTTVDGTSTWSSTSEDGLTSSQTCSFTGGGTFAWDEARYGYELKLIPYATGGALYRKAWLEMGGGVGTVDYKSDCVYSWQEKKTDDNGNEWIETYSESSSSDGTLSPKVWPPGLGAGNALEIGGQGNVIEGGVTSEDGSTRYDWNLRSLRQTP